MQKTIEGICYSLAEFGVSRQAMVRHAKARHGFYFIHEGDMTPQEQSRFDQAAASMADLYPPALARFFKQCIAEGFTREESMRLTLSMFATILGVASQQRENT